MNEWMNNIKLNNRKMREKIYSPFLPFQFDCDWWMWLQSLDDGYVLRFVVKWRIEIVIPLTNESLENDDDYEIEVK